MNVIGFNYGDYRVFLNLDHIEKFAVKKVGTNHYLYAKESLKKMGIDYE